MGKSKTAAQRLAAPGTPDDVERAGELDQICDAHAKRMVVAFFGMLEPSGLSATPAHAIDHEELRAWFVDQLAIFALSDATRSRVVQRLIRRADIAPSAARKSKNSNKAKRVEWAKAEIEREPKVFKQVRARRYVETHEGLSFDSARRYLADL